MAAPEPALVPGPDSAGARPSPARAGPCRLQVAALALILLGAAPGCGPGAEPVEVAPRATMSDRDSIQGRWRKTTRATCAEKYPEELEFSKHGVYRAQSHEEPDRFLLWSGGDYAWADDAHLKIQSATDAMLTYRVGVEDDVLRFVDDEGCEFLYRRVEEGGDHSPR